MPYGFDWTENKYLGSLKSLIVNSAISVISYNLLEIFVEFSLCSVYTNDNMTPVQYTIHYSSVGHYRFQ